MARKKEPPTPQERERGRRIAAWIRSGMGPPHTPVELKQIDVARLSGLSPSAITSYLRGCYDRRENRIKLPTEDTIRRLAAGLGIDPARGIAARYWGEYSTRSDKEDTGGKRGQNWSVWIVLPGGYENLDPTVRAAAAAAARAAFVAVVASLTAATGAPQTPTPAP